MNSPHDPPQSLNRRAFLQATGAAAASIPFAHTAAKGMASQQPAIVGEGDHRYACQHAWCQVPSHVHWFETHGIAVDKSGLVYVTHRGGGALPSSPAMAQDTVVVFDPDGKFVRSFGKEYHGGGHGIDVREENGQEFLYLCCMFPVNVVVKTDLRGEVVWRKDRKDLAVTHKYDDEKARYSPTNVAFAPDGGFYVADGYGSKYIHQYDKNASHVRTWGGTGSGDGQFKTPHGLWLDDRPGREPAIVVADRANARLQYFRLDGTFQKVVDGVSFPAHFDVRGELLLVPDLHARVTLMDTDDHVVTHLGFDADWTRKVLNDGKFVMRTDPSSWVDGRFIHPHDACFDHDGNIYVAEWVATGRIDKLTRL
ncbi:MAG: peptidase [Isosphaeraceae bacterium]